VLPYAGSVAPPGYLMCDGTTGNRTTHATLFALIGVTYGAGDGSTTFGLPNLRGRVPVGRDTSDTLFDALGEVGGEKTHLLTGAESGTPVHTHADTLAVGAVQPWTTGWNVAIASSSWVGTFVDNGTGSTVTNLAKFNGSISFASASHSHPLTGGVSNATAANATTAHNNVQPYQVVNYIIKY